MARSKQSTSKSSSGVLRPLANPETAPPASRLKGRPLKPVPFRPERGSTPENDGAGLTKVGARFREKFAELHNIDPSKVDIGLVRLVEALNADTEANHAALSALQVKRTEFGVLYQTRFVANTPLLLPWLTNGRALRRLGAALGGHTRLLTAATDHPQYGLPVMAVDNAEAVLEMVNAQRKLVKLENYTAAADKRDRIDSIVRFGVLEAPDIVLTNLQSPDGDAWVAQAAEGAQRLFSSLVGLDTLAMRFVHGLATAHWFDGDAALRNLNAEDLRGLDEALKFKASVAASYFPGADEDAWLESVAAQTPAAVAWQLMRTMVVNLTLMVVPDNTTTNLERHPVAATIQELIRSYHVPGKMKDAWGEPDVLGLVAIGVIDELAAQGRVRAAERSSWLGERLLDWSGPYIDNTGEVGNRLLSATRLMAGLTAEGAIGRSDDGREDSLAVVNRFLRNNSKWPHPDVRGRVAAAQAAAALGVEGTGDEGTIVAALAATFRSSWLWKTSEHVNGSWVDLLSTPVRELLARAQKERAAANDDPNVAAGPAQRALAALGAVALIANPGLLAADVALTRTGRGGGGKAADVSASDPSILLERMVRAERGLNQLHDAVAALVLSAEPEVPLDRETSEILGDLWLRNLWLGTTHDPSKTPETEFALQIKELADVLKKALDDSEDLRIVTPKSILNQDDDADELEEEPMFEVLGVNEVLADETLQNLLRLNEFFSTGRAYARAAARHAR